MTDTAPEPCLEDAARLDPDAGADAMPSVDPYGAMMDLKRFYADRPIRSYMILVEAGPRRRPTYKREHFARAANMEKAQQQVQRTLGDLARRARFTVRYAHPIRDLGLQLVETFDPRDPTPAELAAMSDTRNVFCITCRCGHRADIEDFTLTPSGQALPQGQYQCPRCYHAWRLANVTEGWHSPQGLYIPPQRKCVTTLPRA